MPAFLVLKNNARKGLFLKLCIVKLIYHPKETLRTQFLSTNEDVELKVSKVSFFRYKIIWFFDKVAECGKKGLNLDENFGTRSVLH